MKHYLIFGGSKHHNRGGWNDFLDARDTHESAVAYAESMMGSGLDPMEPHLLLDWWHVVDVETGRIVATSANPRASNHWSELAAHG